MTPILRKSLAAASISAALALAPLAHATNGYFKIGYGTKNRGLAGAGMAYGQDSLAPAVNPATLSMVGNRVDGGIELFMPDRTGEVDASGIQVPSLGPGLPALSGQRVSENSGSEYFLIPSFGISRDFGSHMTGGLAIVANGGMNTRYNRNIYTDAFGPVIGQAGTIPSPPFPVPGPSGMAGILSLPPPNGFGVDPNTIDQVVVQMNPSNPDTHLAPSLGVNLAQVLITPTIAYKFNENHSIGFSPIIAYQQFRAYGLGLFAGFSSDPANLTNRGNDYSWGWGGRVGYQGTFGKFSIGGSYTSKIYMDEFDKYKGLFAEEGDFDIPPSYGVGVAFHPTSKLTFAADVTRIEYSEVNAISNKGPTADEFFAGFATVLSQGTAATPGGPLTVSNPLGTDDGWGFGWDDITIVKIGVSYDMTPKWTLRGGFNYSESPYKDEEALFNVLAPATVQKHVTAGFTYNLNPSSQLSMTYMHAFEEKVDNDYVGSGGFSGFGYSAENKMHQNAIEIAYGWIF